MFHIRSEAFLTLCVAVFLQIFAMQLQPEDIVIVGTDGLFDNVFPDESAALVSHAHDRGEAAKAAAKTLADYAFKKAADERHMSPFAYAAQAHGHRYVGGKVQIVVPPCPLLFPPSL